MLVGSRHTAESLWAAMDDPSLERRTRLGPPGVDIEQFGPREPAAARAGLGTLVERVRSGTRGHGGLRRSPATRRPPPTRWRASTPSATASSSSSAS